MRRAGVSVRSGPRVRARLKSCAEGDETYASTRGTQAGWERRACACDARSGGAAHLGGADEGTCRNGVLSRLKSDSSAFASGANRSSTLTGRFDLRPRERKKARIVIVVRRECFRAENARSQRLARASMRVRVSALWDQVASRLGPGNVDAEAVQRAVLRAAGYAWCVPLPRTRVACLASRSRHETRADAPSPPRRSPFSPFPFPLPQG